MCGMSEQSVRGHSTKRGTNSIKRRKLFSRSFCRLRTGVSLARAVCDHGQRIMGRVQRYLQAHVRGAAACAVGLMACVHGIVLAEEGVALRILGCVLQAILV